MSKMWTRRLSACFHSFLILHPLSPLETGTIPCSGSAKDPTAPRGHHLPQTAPKLWMRPDVVSKRCSIERHPSQVALCTSHSKKMILSPEHLIVCALLPLHARSRGIFRSFHEEPYLSPTPAGLLTPQTSLSREVSLALKGRTRTPMGKNSPGHSLHAKQNS